MGTRDSDSLQVVDELQVLVEQVAEVGDREGMHPVVVRGVAVALLHHQAEPGRGQARTSGDKGVTTPSVSPRWLWGQGTHRVSVCRSIL